MTFDCDMDSLSITLDSLKEQREKLLKTSKRNLKMFKLMLEEDKWTPGERVSIAYAAADTEAAIEFAEGE